MQHARIALAACARSQTNEVTLILHEATTSHTNEVTNKRPDCAQNCRYTRRVCSLGAFSYYCGDELLAHGGSALLEKELVRILLPVLPAARQRSEIPRCARCVAAGAVVTNEPSVLTMDTCILMLDRSTATSVQRVSGQLTADRAALWPTHRTQLQVRSSVSSAAAGRTWRRAPRSGTPWSRRC